MRNDSAPSFAASLMLLILLVCPASLAAQASQLASFLSRAWSRSAEAERLRTDYSKARLVYALERSSWLPRLTLSAPQSITRTDGANTFLAGQPLSPQGRHILGDALDFELLQRLPGSGSASLGLSYEVETIIGQPYFRQTPGISLRLSQPLAPGLMSLDEDPATRISSLTLEDARLNYEKGMESFLAQCCTMLRNRDLADLEVRRLEALAKSIDLNTKQCLVLNRQGRLLDAETWKTQRQQLSARRDLAQARFLQALALSECQSLFGNLPYEANEADRASLAAKLESSLGQASDSHNLRLLGNRARRVRLEAQSEESSHRPVLALEFSATPDPYAYYQFADWNGSLSNLFGSPLPWNLSLSLSLKYSMEGTQQIRDRRALSDLEAAAISAAVRETADREKRECHRLRTLIERLDEYREALVSGAGKEDQNNADRTILFSRGMITEIEYWEGEAKNYANKKELSQVEWDLVETMIKLLCLEGRGFAKEAYIGDF